MNLKKIFALGMALCLCIFSASAQMSDSAIISYIKQGVSSGKSESQIGKELLSKGVTANQLQRLMSSYEGSGASSDDVPKTKLLDESRSRIKDKDDIDDEKEAKSVKLLTKKKSFDDDEEDDEDEDLGNEFEDDFPSEHKMAVLKKKPEDKGMKVYGHDFFSVKKLSFEPNENAATPADYVLGPDDEIIIDIWGGSEGTIRKTITPEGYIIISQVGKINLSGLTVEEATTKIRRALSKIYSGPQSEIIVSLGEIRTIQINVMGEVARPGTYRLSPFTTVFNALYKAGGVNPRGSVREIKLMRSGREVASVDLYDYMFNGRKSTDFTLKEGDAIIVPAYSGIVSVGGGVKRPMRYEVKPGEAIGTVIDYAGGFSSEGLKDDILVCRRDGSEMSVYSVSESDFEVFPIADGDSIAVARRSVDLYKNLVEVRGCVYRPGKFELGGDIATVRQLISHAGGLLDDAFEARAQIIREKEDRSLEILAIPIKALVDGSADDVALRKNDILIVSNSHEIEPKGNLTISGYVKEPGNYEFADNMSVEDLILLSGGLADGASEVNVEVSRRIVDPHSTVAKDTLAMVFSFTIKDGLMVDGDPVFVLEPYDVVSVRKSPSYLEQMVVTVSGEVTFPGQYTLLTSNERISDVLKRAGGATPRGYVKGGMLRRKVNQYERNTRLNLSTIAKQNSNSDSLNVKKVTMPTSYTVGVDIEKILQNPGSKYDLILRDDDEIIIPAEMTTVRIQGEVLFPNTVQFIPGRSVSYYVRQAGGFSSLAKRSKVYVLHMNGTVSIGLGSVVDSGSEIVVPTKAERKKMSAAEMVSIGSSAASIAAMVATIVNLVRK